MEEMWKKVCSHYDVPDDVSNCWYVRIRQRLSNPEDTRAYHNWNEMMLRKQEHLQHCKPSLILAAMFQYYTYEGNRSCAKENCSVFEEFCRDAQIDDEPTKCVILRLLGDRSTENELSCDFEKESNLLQDIDLAILASPPAEYKKYMELLRREYNSLNDENYKVMRLKVLETLLIIPNIYATKEFQDKYEKAARENICQEINSLKAK